MSDPKIKSGTHNQALQLNLPSHAQASAKRTAATARRANAQTHLPKQNEAARNKLSERDATRTRGDEPAVRPDKQQRAERQQTKQDKPAHLRELEDRDALRALNARDKERPAEKALRQHANPRNADRQNNADKQKPNAERQERPEHAPRNADKSDRANPNDRAESNARPDSKNRANGNDRSDRNDRAERNDRADRSDRNDHSERLSRGQEGVREARERGRERGVGGHEREPREAHGRGRENDGTSGAKLRSRDSDWTGRESQRNSGGRELAQLRREARGAEPSLLDYLKGNNKSGRDLPTHLREVLDGTTRSVGRNALRALGAGRDERMEKFVEQFVKKFNRTLERQLPQGETPKGLVREAVRELSSVVQMAKHFARLERRGGEVVRRAEERVFNFLKQQTGQGSDGQPSRIRASELWRDLRSGAFQPAPDAHDPFPLTGRARVASEMMELMHTLDAVERALQRLGGRAQGNGQAGVAGDEGVFPNQTGAGVGANGEPEELFVMLPTLPSRAARSEIARFIASLNGQLGQLIDAHGRTLAAPDGTLLKFDQLLWLGTSGAMGGGVFEADAFPTRLSPLHIYGFDALYSLIGFDGRTLNAPRYAAVQVQINASELESVFGQQPLSEGWMRALIERLKDSALGDHNLLGEILEVALADGRLHTVLVSGSVNEGVAAESSFNIAKLLPNIAGDAAGLSPA